MESEKRTYKIALARESKCGEKYCFQCINRNAPAHRKLGTEKL